PASHKVSRASWYSGYQPDSSPFRSTGLSPSLIVLSRTFESHDKSCCWSYNPTSSKDEVVWAPPGSLATTTGISMLISFRRATEMFQFTHCPPVTAYVFSRRSPDITLEGLPHWESPGSSLACSSPGTFRRSPRPSSAFSAKASTLSSVELVLSTLAFTPYLAYAREGGLAS